MSKISMNVDSGCTSLQYDSTEVENWQDCLSFNRVQMQHHSSLYPCFLKYKYRYKIIKIRIQTSTT